MEDSLVHTLPAFYTWISLPAAVPLCRTSIQVRAELGPAYSLRPPVLKANPGPPMKSNSDPVKLWQETQLVAMSVKTVNDKKGREGLVVQGHLKARSLFQPPIPLSDPLVHPLLQKQSLPWLQNQFSELSKRKGKGCLLDCHHPSLPEKAPPPGLCMRP